MIRRRFRRRTSFRFFLSFYSFGNCFFLIQRKKNVLSMNDGWVKPGWRTLRRIWSYAKEWWSMDKSWINFLEPFLESNKAVGLFFFLFRFRMRGVYKTTRGKRGGGKGCSWRWFHWNWSVQWAGDLTRWKRNQRERYRRGMFKMYSREEEKSREEKRR